MPEDDRQEEPTESSMKDVERADVANLSVDDQTKKAGSLAEAQAQRHMERALGRSTQTKLSRFSNNRLDALQPPTDTAGGASSGADAIKDASAKVRTASIDPAGRSNPVLGALALLGIFGCAGYYYYSSTQHHTPVPDVQKVAVKNTPAANSAKAKVLFDSAKRNMNAYNFRKALENLVTAAKIDPANKVLYLEKMGECFVRLKDYKNAASSSRALLELEPNNVNGLLQYALASYSLGNKLSARNSLFKAVQIAPGTAEVFMARGSFYIEEKEFASAELDLEQASKLNPKLPGAKEQLATAKAAQKSAKLRIKTRTVAVSSSDTSEDEAFTKAQQEQLKLSDLSSLRQAGIQAMTSKKYAYATAALERCVVINPNDVQSRKYLAYALINTGNASAAFDQFNAWDSLAKLGLDEQLAFGRALKKAGDEQTTTAFFNFLADDNSTDAQNLLRIAQIADKAGSSASVEKAVNYGLKVSTGTTKYQFTVLMRKVQTGQIGTPDTQTPDPPASMSHNQ